MRISTDKLHSRGQQKSGKAVVALFGIYPRIMGDQRSDAESTKLLREPGNDAENIEETQKKSEES